jgi:hypothetical protein
MPPEAEVRGDLTEVVDDPARMPGAEWFSDASAEIIALKLPG